MANAAYSPAVVSRRSPEHARRLVVAQQQVQLSAGRLRLFLEPPHEVEHLPRIVSTIDDIAELHDVRRTGGPVQSASIDAGDLENLDEPVVGAVNITDGDHALDAGPLAGARGVGRCAKQTR